MNESPNRDVFLREMGITPIWRARTANTESVTAEPIAARTAPVVAPLETPDQRAERIATLDAHALNADIAQCTACSLCNTRKKAVPGVGSAAPEWMVLAAAPAEDDDALGQAFAGRAGQLLDAMLAAVRKSRKQNVYVTHLVKCRPPVDRAPTPDEIEACAPYLERQIALAQPKLFLAIGELAGQALLATDSALDAMRASSGAFHSIPLQVTFHPSDLLRTPLDKAKVWQDLLTAQAITLQT
jgi:uracil-DNA glycosylase